MNFKKNVEINYWFIDSKRTEMFCLVARHSKIIMNEEEILQNDKTKGDFWTWKDLKTGGISTIQYINSNHVIIVK